VKDERAIAEAELEPLRLPARRVDSGAGDDRVPSVDDALNAREVDETRRLARERRPSALYAQCVLALFLGEGVRDLPVAKDA
jgi:hypothetical protein